RRVDRDQIIVARTLGASPARLFLRIAVPASAAGLVSGAGMAWARALGEFGATLMFAGNLSGKTQTLTLAVYSTFESDMRAARAMSAVLVVLAFSLLWFLSRSRAVAPALP
ncbi:MAG: ABC transporter permease subunit, partial [Myxococcota bacterium]